MKDILKDAYWPESFRNLGHQLIDILADHLEEMQSPSGTPVIPDTSPEAEFEFWKADFSIQPGQQDDEAILDLFRHVIGHSIHLHHPHYLGHQIARPAPLAALAGLCVDILNNGMGIYEMGKAGTALERLIIELTACYFNYPKTASGFLTSGGTLANLTALLAARRRIAKQDVWQNGHKQQMALMVSENAHYCVDRAVRIMGWGSAGIITLPVDEKHSIRADKLEEIYQKATSEGVQVIALVGCACTTSTGTFDPLDKLYEFCLKHKLWFHVDAAHGGAAAFSSKYKDLLKGIENADSVVIDYHKMLLSPALATGVIFKNARDGYASFALEAAYLFEESHELEWYNLARRTFECTKQMMSLKIYSLLRTYGTALFDASVTQLFDRARSFAQQIEARENLQLAIQPQANIICFRYFDETMNVRKLNELNAQIRAAITSAGNFYIVQTQLKGEVYLRTTIMNPATDDTIFANLLELVEDKAKALLR